MNKIITTEQAEEISKKLNHQGKTIVLAGGCFDILHRGHIEFLEKAKKQGDILILLLESDESVKRMKGTNRPINTQADRAIVLAALSAVDYIVSLPFPMQNADYDHVINTIKPAIIATTQGDHNRAHKKRQARQTGSKLVTVTRRIADKSTSRLADMLAKEKIL